MIHPAALLLVPAALGLKDAPVDPAPARRLVDVTAEAGLADVGGDFCAFQDADGDGDPDLLIGGARLFRNDSGGGGLRFTDVSATAGLAGGGGGAFADLDRDGRPDVVANSGHLFRNLGDCRFEPFAPTPHLAFPGGAAAALGFGDLDGDGFAEIVTGGAESDGRHWPQSAWRFRPGRGFEEVTQEVGLGAERYGRAVVFCDFDEDGDADVYVGNYRLVANQLFRNDGGRLTDVAAERGATGRNDPTMFEDPHDGQRKGYRFGHTIGAAWLDFDGDGDFDVWASNLVHKAYGAVSPDFAKVLGSDWDDRGFWCDDSNLFVNLGPPEWRFEDRREALGIAPLPVAEYGQWRGDELWSSAAAGDFDGNGFVDVYVNQVYVEQPNSFALLFANRGGRFEEVHDDVGVTLFGGYGAAWADVDGDGDLDLAAFGAPEVKGGVRLHLLRNDGPAFPWVRFRLAEGQEAPALGARLTLVQERAVQVRQVEGATGSHTQQNDERLHFGLGAGGAIDRAIVHWPDGVVQVLDDVAPDRDHEIRRPRGRVPRPTLAPQRARAGEAVTLKVKNAGLATRFLWDFAGERRFAAATRIGTASHVFDTPGRYRVRVLVVLGSGLAGAAAAEIEVE